MWCICLDLSLVEFYIILSLNPSQFQLSLYLSLSFFSIIPYSISFSHHLTSKPYSSFFIKFISPISKQWPKTASLILTVILLYLTDALDTPIYICPIATLLSSTNCKRNCRFIRKLLTVLDWIISWLWPYPNEWS